MPVEYRLFFVAGHVMAAIKYWEHGEYRGYPPAGAFESIGRRINSRFFTMDIAKKPNDEWIIIELGDGQVSGLPQDCLVYNFYEGLNQQSRCCEDPRPPPDDGEGPNIGSALPSGPLDLTKCQFGSPWGPTGCPHGPQGPTGPAGRSDNEKA